MTLTLKNYTKHLTKEQLKVPEKCKVRECDETDQGVFVAYVDEGKDSFDVSLTVLQNGELKKSSCDCENNTALCRHKVALLVHIAKPKKVVKSRKIGTKENTAETLLEQAENGKLKEWLKGLIKKNQDIELSFVSYFSAKKEYYTPREVIKLFNESLKASGCSKKKAEVSQVKKLVELWNDVLQPVIDHYLSNPTDEQAFQSFHTLVEECVSLNSSINSNSGRISRFVEDVMKKAELALNDLQYEESWLLAADHFLCHNAGPSGAIRIHYVMLLKNIISAANEDKRTKLISRLLNQFKFLSSTHSGHYATYAKIIFDIVKTYNLFPDNYKIFKPLYFDNQFNQELIRLLIEINQLELARQYCKAQIDGNYQDQYNIPYLKFLKDIYTLENDEESLANTIKELFPWTFEFDDYLLITSRMEQEERKKWRTKVLSRARNTIRNYNYGALVFCFELMNHEANYRKMIEYIDSYTPNAIIAKYFEPMAAADKTRLLDAIIRRSDSTIFFRTDKMRDDESYLPVLFDLTKKHYSELYLRTLITQHETTINFFTVLTIL